MPEKKRPAEMVWDCAKGLMYRTAYEILKNRTDAEDALMDAMARIVKHEKKFEGLECNNMRALAVIYVRNTAIDLYNRNRKQPYPLDEFPAESAETSSPEEEVIGNDAAAGLLAAIEKMPPSYRDVLLLAGKFGMDNREIAEVLHLENGTVRTRLSRARAILKETIGKMEKIEKTEGDRNA
ncbi:MAG: sigma-70 family RNA polymerase sigma factor [Clostridia bacterium]|nr:sigma-70 family RNA polymerase sigma factor [Clostridia bacterium]